LLVTKASAELQRCGQELCWRARVELGGCGNGAAAAAACCRCLLLRGGERERSGGLRRRQRCSAGVGARVERSQAGCDARRASPVHGRHTAGVLCRGRNGERERARLSARQARRARGWAGPRRGGLVRARGFAGPASAMGRETRRRPVKGEKPFSEYIFKKFSNTSFQISF